MKKMLFVLTLVLLLTFTACNRTPANTDGGNSTATTTANATTTTTTPLLGDSDGNTYKNAHFGIAFTPADGWDMFDNTEIADRNLPILSPEDGETYEDAVARAQEFYDMYAMQDGTGNTIAVRVENMSTMYDFLPTAEEYRDIQTSMLEDVPSLTYSPFTATVSNTEFAGLKIVWGEGEYAQHDACVYIVNGTYMVSLEFSSIDGDHVDEWLSWFALR